MSLYSTVRRVQYQYVSRLSLDNRSQRRTTADAARCGQWSVDDADRIVTTTTTRSVGWPLWSVTVVSWLTTVVSHCGQLVDQCGQSLWSVGSPLWSVTVVSWLTTVVSHCGQLVDHYGQSLWSVGWPPWSVIVVSWLTSVVSHCGQLADHRGQSLWSVGWPLWSVTVVSHCGQLTDHRGQSLCSVGWPLWSVGWRAVVKGAIDRQMPATRLRQRTGRAVRSYHDMDRGNENAGVENWADVIRGKCVFILILFSTQPTDIHGYTLEVRISWEFSRVPWEFHWIHLGIEMCNPFTRKLEKEQE